MLHLGEAWSSPVVCHTININTLSYQNICNTATTKNTLMDANFLLQNCYFIDKYSLFTGNHSTVPMPIAYTNLLHTFFQWIHRHKHSDLAPHNGHHSSMVADISLKGKNSITHSYFKLWSRVPSSTKLVHAKQLLYIINFFHKLIHNYCTCTLFYTVNEGEMKQWITILHIIVKF